MSEEPEIRRVQVLRPVDAKISSPFGNRVLRGNAERHNGIDFACPVGTSIRAVVTGVVHRAGWQDPARPSVGFGLRVWQVATVAGYTFDIFYGHCSELLVKDGEPIERGQIIAKSGNTGSSTGPHLHLGLRRTKGLVFYDAIFESLEPDSGAAA